MPSEQWSGRDPRQRMRDVIDAIYAIAPYIKGYDESAYVADRKTQSAVERELLIVSEAVS